MLSSATATVLTYPATVGTYLPAMKLAPQFGIMPLTLPFIGNVFALGAEGSAIYAPAPNVLVPSLTPTQAWMLDKKMDDGIPSGGNVRIVKFPSQPTAQGVYYTNFDATNDDNIASGYYTPVNCVNNLTSYNLSNTGVVCMLFIKMQ